MAGTVHVVAEGLAARRAHEYRTGAFDAVDPSIGFRDIEREMLRRIGVRDVERGCSAGGDENTHFLKALARDAGARQRFKLAENLALDSPRRAIVERDENDLRVGVVLRLAEKISSDNAGVGAGVSDDEKFARSRRQVDPRKTTRGDLALCLRDIGVAGTEDFLRPRKTGAEG